MTVLLNVAVAATFEQARPVWPEASDGLPNENVRFAASFEADGRPLVLKGKRAEAICGVRRLQKRAEIIWTHPIRKDQYIGWPTVCRLKDGEILLIENVRFHKEEEKNDPAFAKELASLAEIFVNDAFGAAHRAHASTAGVAMYGGLPAVCGYLVEKEVSIMGKALTAPERPFVAILGGAKVSDKIGVINNLIEKVDTLIIGGGMAYTFKKAQGLKIGNSLCEDEQVAYCKEMLDAAASKGIKILLPVDNVIANKFPETKDASDIEMKACEGDIPDGWMGLDIGPKSVALFSEAVKGAKTVVWNGPMGCFEFAPLSKGTYGVCEAVATVKANGGTSIIGGGDSVSAVKKSGKAAEMSHVSTGGGASLEFLEGKVLPGVAALTAK